MDDFQQAEVNSGVGFLQLVEQIRKADLQKLQFSEDTDLERVMDKMADKSSVLNRMPRKYLRAFIAFLDFRILQLGVNMSEAHDGVTMAHNQGRLREVTEVQSILRFFLEQQLQEVE